MLFFFSYLFLAECERKKFMGMLEGQKEIVYTISRANLFNDNDVLSLYIKDKGLFGFVSKIKGLWILVV